MLDTISAPPFSPLLPFEGGVLPLPAFYKQEVSYA